MSVLIFGLLGSVSPEDGRTRADEVRNGAFSTIAFVLGALTSCLSGYLGMKIATYANARTAVEARRGIAPAFMTGAFALRALGPRRMLWARACRGGPSLTKLLPGAFGAPLARRISCFAPRRCVAAVAARPHRRRLCCLVPASHNAQRSAPAP